MTTLVRQAPASCQGQGRYHAACAADRPAQDDDGAFYAHVSGSVRVITRGGIKPIAKIAPGTVVWTGAEWAPVQIEACANPHCRYRVELSDGQRITCGHRQTWALKDQGALVGRPTRDLHSRDIVHPFILPEPPAHPDRLDSTSAAAGVRAEAASEARQLADIEDMFGAGCGEILSFISGWIRAQGGHLIAKSDKAAAALRLLLLRVGIGPCQTCDTQISIPERFQHLFHVGDVSACFVPQEARPLRINNIEKLRPRTSLYRLWFAGPATAQSIVAETSLLLVPNIGAAAAPGSPGSAASGSSGGTCEL